jgi:hypothetical protein
MLSVVRFLRLAVAGCAVASLAGSVTPTFAQGSVGPGRAPRTASEIKRNLKTTLVVKAVKPELLTFEAKDEITNEELTYKISRNTKIATEKGFPLIGKGKELTLADLKPGQRLEVVYRESLPTQLTKITVLKAKE